jgi:acyl carrier protein
MPRNASPRDIKRLIIETLDLEDLAPEDIGDDEPLFGGRLGLDSVDALELSLALERAYGVKVEASGGWKDRLGTPAALARWVTDGRG